MRMRFVFGLVFFLCFFAFFELVVYLTGAPRSERTAYLAVMAADAALSAALSAMVALHFYRRWSLFSHIVTALPGCLCFMLNAIFSVQLLLTGMPDYTPAEAFIIIVGFGAFFTVPGTIVSYLMASIWKALTRAFRLTDSDVLYDQVGFNF